jgi:hypothetical protein
MILFQAENLVLHDHHRLSSGQDGSSTMFIPLLV